MSFNITVPATSANLGAGFDSIGIALNLYMTLTIESSDAWIFNSESEHLKDVETDERNFIYQVALKVAKRYHYDSLPPQRVVIQSDIPLARGLGSSATAIAAGIELANQLLNLNLAEDEKVLIATEIEGHPDNVAPAILGGCVIGYYDQELYTSRIPVQDVTFLTIIPNFELKTSDARKVLPESFSYSESVQASSVANVSVAAIASGDWGLLGEMMKKDRFHHPYRQSLIPHYSEVEKALSPYVYGTYISGAGPTMIAIVEQSTANQYIEQWSKEYPSLLFKPLKPVNKGLVVHS
ncbi:homoserine kinase [Pelagirhabdus alkalitolerans]|uniref:Homoserine kinase n=1 Tax=Pelagirhabdus alkalitolerans TaxID=1612202 RepID=A0A1G6LTS2_9BACI|nr:homoserine kinase [Pelagirhabdus alkalitolerans]SDC46145.1 homoserine kinase [Pelagirhabdus alkalitolerans]